MTRHPSRRQLELRRIEEGLALELTAYPNRWVAIRHGRVVASDPTAAGLLAILREKDIPDAALHFVPRPGTVFILAAAAPA